MRTESPFLDEIAVGHDEELVVRKAQDGDRESLEWLARRHSPWIYNIALRMLGHPDDAQDASQEILVKVITRLSTFEGRSSFRTWLYRIAFNHLLTMKRLRRERWTFEAYGRALEELPDRELVDLENWLKALPVVITEAEGQALEVDGTGPLAYVRGTYTMSLQVPSVTQPVRQEGKFLQIYGRQQDGTWLLAREIWSVNASPPSR
jgi:hypothetical protein